MLDIFHGCADQAGIVRGHSAKDAVISKQALSSKVHPYVQEDHPAKIPAAPEDAEEGSPASNASFSGPEKEGPKPGHVQEPGRAADTPGLHGILELNPMQECSFQAPHAAGEQTEDHNMSDVQQCKRQGAFCPEKVVLSYGINRREVGLRCPSSAHVR